VRFEKGERTYEYPRPVYYRDVPPAYRPYDQEDAPVQRNIRKARRIGGQQRFKQGQTACCQSQSEGAPDGGQKNALRDELTHDSGASSTERNAHRDLFASNHRTGKREVGYVRACD